MSERFGGYELVHTLRTVDAGTLWLARDARGDACELLVATAARDDIDEAFFRGEEIPRFRAAAALDDARLPRLVGEPLRVDGRNALRFVHTPFVAVEELSARADVEDGLAFPFVAALARDIASALVAAHHAGLVGLAWLGVGVDGRVRLWLEREGTAAFDVRRFGFRCTQLAFGSRITRDVPPQFTSALAWTFSPEAPPPTARVLVEALDDDALAWARWTPAQVTTELRALFPDLESRR